MMSLEGKDSTTTSSNEAGAVSSKQFKPEDLLQYSNIFASEFNKSGLHDRVLVFQVTEEECLFASCLDKSDLSTNQQVTSDIKCNEEKVLAGDDQNDVEDEVKIETEFNESTPNVESETESSESVEETRRGEGGENDEVSKSDSPLQGPKENDTNDTSLPPDGNDEAEVEADVEGETDEVPPADTVKEQRIFVHSCWLAVQSSYFRSLFFSGMKESNSKEVFMQVTEEELTPHLTLIEAMYQPDILDNKDWNLVLKVLTLANKYDVTLVFKKCKYVLMSMPMSLDVCECILTAVDEMLATNDLLAFLEKFLVNEFRPLDRTWRMDKFKDLSETALRLLISSNDLAVLSENTIFVALMHWLKYNELVGPSLLLLVRPELMTVNFLYDVVQHHYVAMKMDGFNQLLLNGFSYHSFSAERKSAFETKPSKRTEYSDVSKPTFSWVIDNDMKKQLANSSKIYSQRFWSYGYEMYLSLSLESNLCSIFLYVCNTRKKGTHLNISWEIKSDLFAFGPETFSQVFTTSSSGWGRKNTVCKYTVPIPEHITPCIDIWVNLVA